MGKLSKWDEQHIRNAAFYAQEIEDLYRILILEAAAIGVSVSDFNPNRPFSFSDYPQTKRRIEQLLKKMREGVTAVVINGIEAEWTLSNNKNSELARRLFGDNIGKLTQAEYRRYFSTNDAARQAFIARKTAGMTISDRVWKYTNQFKNEIEFALDIGIRSGLPAAQMARELRQYLQQPDKLFRRVRDEHGQLQLSKSALAYHPGVGVYRSSQKNAERLARTETNMAYRGSDWLRWQQLDFVVGYEVRRSNNPYPCVLCETLVGKYPKYFKFMGWHPQCRCIAIPILKTEEEFLRDNEHILSGEITSVKSVNEIDGVPEQFKMWVRENEERIAMSNQRGTLPLFLKENRKMWERATKD